MEFVHINQGIAMSRIVDFYLYDGNTEVGYRLEMLWSWSDDKLESAHDYIQWMFPTNEPSNFNPEAPLLDATDIRAFEAIPFLRPRLLRSFEVFLNFLGLKLEEDVVQPAENFEARKKLLHTPNHNWMRITRVIQSLRLLGLEKEAKEFYRYLAAEVPDTVQSKRFWEAAANAPQKPCLPLS